jgi:flavin reductase (DIM6/NTAB) family NADH-FMN oxidoreductase RutF
MQIDRRALRDTLGRYATGVAIVGAVAADGRRVGLTINSFASLSLEPPLVLWSLANRSPNLATFRECGGFSISVLASGQHALARRFADPAVDDRFDGIAVRGSPQGRPWIGGSLAWLCCSLSECLVAGDHTLFIGRVESHAAGDGEPLLFFRGAMNDSAAAAVCAAPRVATV